MKLKVTGLSQTISKLERVSNIINNTDKILEKVCEIGKEEIKQAHQGTMGVDHVISGETRRDIVKRSDINVNVVKNGKQYKIVATGRDFVYYEFGAGVKRNNPRKFENVLDVPVPSGIAPIGTYGKGQGKQQSWVYQNDDNERIITGGYEARQGFARAINKMVAEVDGVVKEVGDGKR